MIIVMHNQNTDLKTAQGTLALADFTLLAGRFFWWDRGPTLSPPRR